MPVYVCSDHDAHYVGGASVVVAADEQEAQALLDAELATHGLKGRSAVKYTLTLLDTWAPKAIVLHNGDY